MILTSTTFAEGALIPPRCAYGRVGPAGETAPSDNLNPQLAWSGAPEGVRSWLLCCLDDDVPQDFNGRDLSGEMPASMAPLCALGAGGHSSRGDVDCRGRALQ